MGEFFLLVALNWKRSATSGATPSCSEVVSMRPMHTHMSVFIQACKGLYQRNFGAAKLCRNLQMFLDILELKVENLNKSLEKKMF